MAKTKQHVFSARTTEAGLELLNELKDRLHIGWDELVINGISAHYKLDKAVMSLPKKEKPVKAEEKSDILTKTEKEASAKVSEKKQPAAKKKGGKKTSTGHNIEKVD